MSATAIYNPRYETMPREELLQLQLERLQATVNRAYKNVAHYRRVLDSLGLQPEDFQSLEDLRKLPFTTKDDLRASYPYDMVAVPLREVVRFHMSSGTTGAPTVMAYTANDLAHWTELVARNLVAGGITREDVVQIFFGYGLFSGGFGLHQGAEAIGASVLPVSSAELPQQVQIMQDFRTTALVGMPSYALEIADAVEQAAVDPNSLFLRVGLFGAEPWTEETRQEIEQRLYLTAYDIYGLSEMGGPGVAGECQERAGLHIAEDYFLVEVIDPATGEVLPEGEEGELVFTTLAREALPLLRYRSGDISRLDTSPCACGRTLARMARVSRRADDMVIIHGINVFPDDIARLLAEFPALGQRFQLVVDRPGGRDTLELRVEMAGLASDIPHEIIRIRQDVARRLEQLLGIDVQVTFLEPNSLLVNGRPAPRVVDHRQS
ncbi:MAG: phenylacetate--CoA ligase [Armatimonadetes bacterium]|nr:phenylacetate--CoA ligase [Armatimonadota bacterium]